MTSLHLQPKPFLLTLPPELLTPIFQQADISLSNLIICRALLPYTLHALLVEVDLFSQAQIRSFHGAVQHEDKARLVRMLTMSTSKDSDSFSSFNDSSEEDSGEEGSSGSEWTSTDDEAEPKASKPVRVGGVVQEEKRQYRSYAVAEALREYPPICISLDGLVTDAGS